MAISLGEYWFLSWIAKRNIVPKSPQIIELGEQHWHGDVPIESLKNTLENMVKDNLRKKNLLEELERIILKKDKQKIFELTKIAYKVFFDYQSICAIDLHGTKDALQFDLNQPVEIERTFDITINFGTGEHIFNVYQFFKTIHELTAPGGLMLHVMPFLGWLDHGFFNFQPTFYWDLAESNGYEVAGFLLTTPTEIFEVKDRQGIVKYLQNRTESISSANIYAVFKQHDSPASFQIPMQKFFQMSTEEYWNLARDPFSQIAERLKLREINAILAPDWRKFEKLVFSELEVVLKYFATYPDRQKMTLLIDSSNLPNNSAINPESVLCELILNLLVEEGLDIANDGPEISLVEDLSEQEWQFLLPQVRYRIPLELENPDLRAELGKMELLAVSK